MAYHIQPHPESEDLAVIAIDGKVDKTFIDHVAAQLAGGRRWLLINLARSQAIRGDHIEWMIEAHHAAEKAGGRLALCEVPADFGYILSIMQLDQFFQLFDTELAGVMEFSRGALAADSYTADASGDDLPIHELDELALPDRAEPAYEAQKRETRGLSRREIKKREAEAKQRRAELFVRNVAPGMSYLRVFEVLTRPGNTKGKGKSKKDGPIDVRQLQRDAKQSAGAVKRVLNHLVELRICERDDKGAISYRPNEVIAGDVGDFLLLYNNPANRGMVMKWVYQEEQRQQEESGLLGRVKRLFGRS